MARSARASARPGGGLGKILDLLEGNSEGLGGLMLNRYVESIPSYRSLAEASLRAVRDVSERNVRGFITAVREERGPTLAELATIRDGAVRRAREGVPLSGLLAAYRSGAQVAWEQALEIIDADPTLQRAGLDLATAVMRWTDDASSAAAQAYLAEYERLSTDREASRRDFIDGVLSGSLREEEVIARAEALGLDGQAPHAVALLAWTVAPDDDAEGRAATRLMLEIAATLTDDDDGPLVIARGSEVLVVFPSGSREEMAMTERLRAALQDAPDVRAGIGRVRASVVEIAGSYREALIALTAARAGSSSPVALYGEVLVEEMILRERKVAQRLADSVLSPLADHPDLRKTLVAFMLHGPSLPAVARHLFLHANTVAYRLNRVRELTGRDPKTPAGTAELFLALRAAELVGTGHD